VAGMNTEMRRVGAMVWKDLTAERRTKANFNAVVFFATLMLLLFGFAIGPDNDMLQKVGSGILWLTVLYSGVLVFNRSYQVELEGGALEALLLYPGDRKSIFVGKVLSNFAFILLVEAVVIPLTVVFYHVPIFDPFPGLGGVILLGTFGFVTLGTFYAAVASRIRAREVLLPLLLFPMLIPLLVASVEATSLLLAGDPMGEVGRWVRLLVVFDVIFFVGTLFAFDYVIEE
jgi:heme exporter protein B